MINISIIIPTCNRADQLFATLNSLMEIEFDTSKFEIIVVDNGSEDNTKEIVENFIAKFPEHHIHYFYDAIPGLLTGRHRGAKEAFGNILVFIDDDIEADRNWLTSIAEAFLNPDVHLVGGKSLPKYEVHPPDWLENFWKNDAVGKRCPWLSLLDLGEVSKQIDPIFVWGLNFSIRKKTLYDLGGFHPDNVPSDLQYLQGDGETGLSQKMRALEFKAMYVPGALVYHVIPNERLTFGYFEKRAFYQGVCASYSEIRKAGKVIPQNDQVQKKDFTDEYKKKQTRFDIFSLLKNKKNIDSQKNFDDLLARTKKSYFGGYQYHQQAVKNNPELLEWVTRKDYFNYNVPIIKKQ
ncbi:glycosyltransferase family 2 protein [soil metagenome]